MAQAVLARIAIPLPPPLKWAGGKRWLLPHLLPIWESHQRRRLVEPFVGGMAVALGLRPKSALLNDNNPHLINFYRWLQQGKLLDDPSVPLRNSADTYYANRSRFNDLIRRRKADTPEAATLFYYLNRTGYNGLCRFSSKGTFNVPFGRYRNINYAKRRDFDIYVEALGEWELSSVHFRDLVIDEADFVYADPPYDVEFTSYSPGGFSWEDQQELAEWLYLHKGPVVASNQATNRILRVYKKLGFKYKLLSAPRRISCNGDRTPQDEMLAWRNLDVAKN
jgi:DNA adenine methylase